MEVISQMKGMTAKLAFQRMTALAAPYLCSIPTVYWDSVRGKPESSSKLHPIVS
jgi:hypothetical protein